MHLVKDGASLSEFGHSVSQIGQPLQLLFVWRSQCSHSSGELAIYCKLRSTTHSNDKLNTDVTASI